MVLKLLFRLSRELDLLNPNSNCFLVVLVISSRSLLSFKKSIYVNYLLNINTHAEKSRPTIL